MTKILHIPSGQILTFLITGYSKARTTEYEDSCYCEDPAVSSLEDGSKFLPLATAENFIASMCNTVHINRHHRFKERFRIDKFCVKEEFEIIQ